MKLVRGLREEAMKGIMEEAKGSVLALLKERYRELAAAERTVAEIKRQIKELEGRPVEEVAEELAKD